MNFAFFKNFREVAVGRLFSMSAAALLPVFFALPAAAADELCLDVLYQAELCQYDVYQNELYLNDAPHVLEASLYIPGVAVDDESLSAIHGRGSESSTLEKNDRQAVILWDERGKGKRRNTIAGQNHGAGNIQSVTVTMQRR